MGTHKDIEVSHYITKQNKKYLISLCGKTDLYQLMNIIKFSKIHITNDNGSMHIASLFLKKQYVYLIIMIQLENGIQ